MKFRLDYNYILLIVYRIAKIEMRDEETAADPDIYTFADWLQSVIKSIFYSHSATYVYVIPQQHKIQWTMCFESE